MGQYHLVINLDKQQYLYAHAFGDGLKLLEFGSSGSGLMCGLAILLAKDNGRGGGDLNDVQDPKGIIGSWAGDRITIAGDYGDNIPGEVSEKDGYPLNQYQLASERYLDISADVIAVMRQDQWLNQDLTKRGAKF